MQTVTLEDIHRDPAILDRALKHQETIEILDGGKIAGTLVPAGTNCTVRYSERGFPISKGLAAFGASEVGRIEREAGAQ